jgi:alpha-tubulin suppressor-like RCC1 family protein
MRDRWTRIADVMNARYRATARSPAGGKIMKAVSRGLLVCWMLGVAALLAACHYNDDYNNTVQVQRQSTPLQVTLAQPVAAPAAGWAHTCASFADGTMSCWGGNQAGQLGNASGALVSCVQGYSICSNGPVTVSGTTQWTNGAGGYLYTCAIDNAGAAHCWGAGKLGQLGNGTLAGANVPTNVSGGLIFTQLSAAMGGDLACGISTNALYCWGTGYFGQPGTGGVSQVAAVPYRVAPAQSFNSVSVGELHACALDTTSAAHCWGANGLGQVGDGTTIDRTLPTVVLGGRTYTQIVTGLAHTCALDGTGVAFCWGASGQIGRTTTTSVEQATPGPVAGAQQFVRIAAGGWHTCGIDTGGQTYCWGDNSYSQFGDGGTTSSQLPRLITGLPLFTQLTAGGAHTCGVTAAGAMYCWGANTYGQSGRLP